MKAQRRSNVQPKSWLRLGESSGFDCGSRLPTPANADNGSVWLWHAHLARDSRPGRSCHLIKLNQYARSRFCCVKARVIILVPELPLMILIY